MTHYCYSFGMIVFNGDEFLHQVLDSIYDFAHQIIIAEGADQNARPFANLDGSSTDRTVDIIRNYPDKERKITLVQGTWRDKTEQSNAWLEHATGDYVWQIDDDEIYKEEDLLAIDALLRERPDTTAVSFHWWHFFGGLDRIRPINERTRVKWRIFRFKPGYQWHTHRPPDILDPNTGKSLREISPIMAQELVDRGIYIYHFSYITDRQVREKMQYMERVRMYEYDFGMHVHPLWGLCKRSRSARSRFPLLRPIVALLARYFQWWKRRPIAIELRKQADKSWNYRFYEDVWLPWRENPAAIEGRGILSTEPGFYSITEPFQGTLPRAVLSHPLAQAHKVRLQG
jgi:glycosyltransferase involved in cell wall biosynthesis